VFHPVLAPHHRCALRSDACRGDHALLLVLSHVVRVQDGLVDGVMAVIVLCGVIGQLHMSVFVAVAGHHAAAPAVRSLDPPLVMDAVYPRLSQADHHVATCVSPAHLRRRLSTRVPREPAFHAAREVRKPLEFG
jgi:hypothetical protein